MSRGRRGWLVGVLVLIGCGSSEPAGAPPAVTSAETADEATPRAEVPASTADDEAPPAAAANAEPVDLLRAVPTSVAVSSAYRDGPEQVARLVDGDLETAWNSRTGDLAGAWIAFRIPDDATVTSIGLTAGFTHVTERADLFTGNHRVARVRVTRGGETLAERALDPSSREVQSIPVAGGGGDYRIEIVEVAPGTRDDWRETCVSELRVMGRAPGAGADRYAPRTAIGELPALPSLDDTVEALEDEALAEEPDALYLRVGDRFLIVDDGGEVMGPDRPSTFTRDQEGQMWRCEQNGRRGSLIDTDPLPEGMGCGPMAIDANGHPWVLTEGSLAYWDGDEWTITAGGFVGPQLQDLAIDGDGTLWVVGTSNVYRRRDGRFESVAAPTESSRMFEIHAAGTHVLVRHQTGLLRGDGSGLRPLTLNAPGGPVRYVSAAALAPDGTVVAAHGESGSLFVAGPGASARRVPLDSIEARPMHVGALTHDAAGRIWMWADAGLYVLAPDASSVVRRHAPGTIEDLLPEAHGGAISEPVQEILVTGRGPDLPTGAAAYHVHGRLVRGGAPLANTAFHFCTNPVRNMRGTSYGDPCEETGSHEHGYVRYLRTRADGTFDVWDAVDGVPVNVVLLRSDRGGWYYSPDSACCERMRPGRAVDLGDLEVP